MSPQTVPTEELLQVTAEALAPAGEFAADLVARALLDAEVRGHARFGLRLLDGLPTGSRDELAGALAAPEPVAGGPSWTADLSGRLAPVAVARLIEPARRRASQFGISIVRLRDIGPFGRLAPYVSEIARHGAIGLLTMSSRSFVAPLGGGWPALGTNPFALGVPTGDEPLVIDTASSAITAAHWHDAQEGLRPVPDGGLVDVAGHGTTDVAAATAIAPRGGLLGSSVGIAVEALTAAATGLLSDPAGAPRGGLLLVIEPAEGAFELGSALAQRLVAAGGRIPGRPVPWPPRIAVDAAHLDRLHQLAELSAGDPKDPSSPTTKEHR